MGERVKLNVDNVEYYCVDRYDNGRLIGYALYTKSGKYLGTYGSVSEAVDSLIGGKPSKRIDGDIQECFMRNIQKLKGDMTRAEFAEKLDMNGATVYQYISGRRFPSPTALVKMAEKCGVTVDWLLGKEEQSTLP